MILNRREFLQAFGATTATVLAGCASAPDADSGRAKVAAQLYSINKIFWKKPEWCLEGLKAAGYDGVEFAGYANHTAKEIRQYLDDAGLIGMGSHVNGFTALRGDELKKTLDFCAEAGFETVTTPHAICKSSVEYRQFGRDMSKAAEIGMTYGIRVGVHPTYDHFRMLFNGISAWDLIFSEASPLLQQQIDTSNAYTVIRDDLFPLIERYRGRHYSIHLKESAPSATAALGETSNDGKPAIPWRRVFDCLSSEEVRWYVVEAERIPDSLEPLAKSRRFLELMI